MTPDILKKALHKKPNANLGVYVHIPFCRVRCQFCAFYVRTYQDEAAQAFLEGLDREIHLYGRELGLETIPVTSVYVGGGTPTVLPVRQLGHVLESIRNCFAVKADAEISIETHPGTVTRESLAMLRSRGFNRLSIGAQSFDDQELLQLGGRSMSRATHTAVDSAREAGFENISLDLMYGFPGHGVASWEQTLDAAVALRPTHLSCYAFTVDEGSHFYEMVERGTALVPDEAVQVSLGRIVGSRLEEAGYVQYEVSNFCLPGFACRHNLRYWQCQPYLGLGPSAQSFVSDVRFGNAADLDSYCNTLVHGQLPVDQWESLDAQDVQREQVVFGLRTMRGVSGEQVRLLSARDAVWARTFSGLKEQGLLAEEEGYVRLTEKGIRFSDTVAVALI